MPHNRSGPYQLMTSDNFKESLKQQADIVRIVGDYVKLKKAGAQNFSGLCPFHSEKTPSFSVHAIRQFYHCFGCGVSGDVFSFVQKIENITFPEAVRLDRAEARHRLCRRSPSRVRRRQGKRKLRTVLLEIHERACTFFQERLKRPEGAHAREYLEDRGLDDENHRSLPYRLCARFRLSLARRAAGEVRRRTVEGKWVVFVEEDSSQLSANSSQEKAGPSTPTGMTIKREGQRWLSVTAES